MLTSPTKGRPSLQVVMLRKSLNISESLPNRLARRMSRGAPFLR